MDIKAVVERIEDENAILVSDEIGIEISIPLSSVDGNYYKGDIVCITIEEKNM